MTSTLSKEIGDDHASILIRLRRLSDCPEIDPQELSAILLAIGAHHLAEEDTLYKALESVALAEVEEAKIYHLVLDDLTYSMAGVDGNEVSLGHQLQVLGQLLSHHFLTEESGSLVVFAAGFTLQQQLELGRQYRDKYRENITALQPDSHRAPAAASSP